MFKSLLVFLLFSFSLANARTVSFVCSDETVAYDTQALKSLDWYFIKNIVAGLSAWDETEQRYIEPNGPVRIRMPHITAQGLTLMIKLSQKTDAQAFAFINSLNDQAFKLLCMYSNAMDARRIAQLLVYKIILNPNLEKIADIDPTRINSFAINKAWILLDELVPYDSKNYVESENKRRFLYRISHDGNCFVAMVHFYKETLKKPLIVNTDQLKKLYQGLPDEARQLLLDKNLIVMS